VKKTIPIAIGMIAGLYAVVEYFIPHHAVRDASSHVFEWGGIVAAAAYVIGGVNLVQVTWPKIRRREADWQYKIVLLAAAAIMALVALPMRDLVLGERAPGEATLLPQRDPIAAARGKAIVKLTAPADVAISVGAIETTAAATPFVEVDPGVVPIKAGKRVVGYDAFAASVTVQAGDVVAVTADPQMQWGTDGRVRTWIYDHVFAPCNATMFALLAFFVASAAFRAFRARNIEAALLLGSAIIVLVARAPIGRWISTSIPHLSQWILDIPSNGSRRAIIMGAAVGAIATGLRVILGLERSHLGGDS
jgi:hypothetical protein